MKRTTHWATREFHSFLLARARMPFAWGKNDCALFAADAIWAFTGEDIAVDFRALVARRTKAGIRRARYADEASAFALIKEVTGKGLDPATAVGDAAEYCARQAGVAEWPHPLQAQRGDLVVIQDSGRLIAGVMHLNGRDALSVGADGLKRLPHAAVVRAWHV